MPTSDPVPLRLALVLAPGFSTLDASAVLESAQHTNASLERRAVSVTTYGINTPHVTSKSGLSITCDDEVATLLAPPLSARPDVIILCCGSHIPHDVRPRIRKLLRSPTAKSARIIGIGNAAWLIAECGLLKGRAGTVHWEYMRAFSERYMDVEVQNALYVDGERVQCCAGEAATLDLMYGLIKTQISEDVANDVLNRLLIAYPRRADTAQPGSQERRMRHKPQVLHQAIQLMANNIEDPLRISTISESLGLSTRQLERLFKQHLNSSPRRTYLKLQLEQAAQLIEQTEMPLSEVSVACGMRSSNQLSRHFRKEFGMTPTALRHQNATALVA